MYAIKNVCMSAYTCARAHKQLQLIINVMKLPLFSDQLPQIDYGSGASFTSNLLLGIIVAVFFGSVILALVNVIYERRSGVTNRRIYETPVRAFYGLHLCLTLSALPIKQHWVTPYEKSKVSLGFCRHSIRQDQPVQPRSL